MKADSAKGLIGVAGWIVQQERTMARESLANERKQSADNLVFILGYCGQP